MWGPVSRFRSNPAYVIVLIPFIWTGMVYAQAQFYSNTATKLEGTAVSAIADAILGSGTPSSSTFLRGDRTWAVPGGSGGLPSGLIVLILSGTCPSGFTEVSALSGKFLLGTVAANGDVGTTGGSDNITPAGTNSAPAFTGQAFSGVINHTHGVTDPGHNHTQNSHNHTQNSFAPRIINSGTAGTVGVQGASAASNANASNSATTATNQAATATNIAATTGVTTQNPAGGVSSITPAGTVAAPTFTGTQFDNRPAFVKAIFCSAN